MVPKPSGMIMTTAIVKSLIDTRLGRVRVSTIDKMSIAPNTDDHRMHTVLSFRVVLFSVHTLGAVGVSVVMVYGLGRHSW